MPLSEEELTALLTSKKVRRATGQPKAPQGGRLTDQELRERYPIPECTSKLIKYIQKSKPCENVSHSEFGELVCGAPSYYELIGKPTCNIHMIHILVDLLEEKINHFPTRSTQAETHLKLYFNTYIKSLYKYKDDITPSYKVIES